MQFFFILYKSHKTSFAGEGGFHAIFVYR